MRVKMLTIMAGPEGVFQPGAVRELPTPQAQMLIQAGAAVAVDPEPGTPTRVKATAPARETAAVAPPETPETPAAAKPKA